MPKFSPSKFLIKVSAPQPGFRIALSCSLIRRFAPSIFSNFAMSLVSHATACRQENQHHVNNYQGEQTQH